MTRILYKGRMNEPHHPDEIWLGKEAYSLRRDWKVNGWLLVGALISGASDIVFPHAVQDWPLALRAVIAVAPFLAILIWARSLAAWVRGMDELHRRIVQAAILSATASVFFFVTLWQRLGQVLFEDRPAQAYYIGTVGHIFLLLTIAYFLSYRFFSRRYQ
jgi:hypothetical protein